ncbi:PQQ-binding-like beta-propeller repeat protein [Halopiger thermotolerans]
MTGVAAGSLALAGCATSLRTTDADPEPDDPPPSGVDELPDPDGHVDGANGDWLSFGCNGANTRAVADGKAPVNGVSERWRIEVSEHTRQEPVVADGRVYQVDYRTLRTVDAADGTELWTLEDVWASPLVWDGTVYVPTRGGLQALEAETGEQLWSREFDTPGRVTTPATYAGHRLVCGAGEQVVALDPADGTVEWRRRVYGQLLNHPAVFMGYGFALATEAGEVYLLMESGTGWWRWQLPASPMCPPTAGTDSLYITCQDGNTYALMDGGTSSDPTINWTTDTGWVEHGIGLVDDIVFGVGGQKLHALDAESGDRYWTYDTGDWQRTAPAYGRDTVFVGGDRLRALDPTPGDDPADGPALRFEREFAGSVGPGPVLDDGVLYAIAEVEAETYALVALE